MSGTSRVPKILLIDSNVYFSKRLADALKKEGFQVLASTQPAFALTTLEYDIPTAVVCATNMRDMGALEIATIIKADPKNANLPIIALGDGSQPDLEKDEGHGVGPSDQAGGRPNRRRKQGHRAHQRECGPSDK